MYPCNHFTDSFSGIHDLPMAWIAGFAGLLRGPKWHSGAFVGSSEICSCVFVFSKWLKVEAGSWVFKQKKNCIVYSIYIYKYTYIIKILSDSKTSRKKLFWELKSALWDPYNDLPESPFLLGIFHSRNVSDPNKAVLMSWLGSWLGSTRGLIVLPCTRKVS